MSVQTELTQYLTDHPMAREADNRNQAVWNFLRRKYKFEFMTETWFYGHGQEIDSARKLIGDIQRDHEELQGTDYPDRIKREQEYLLKAGYEVGFYQDIKQVTI